MITYFSPNQLRHQGTAELIDGQMVPCFEKPERATIILDALRSHGHSDIREPITHAKADYALAHSSAFIDFLERAFDQWARKVGPRDALPFAWPGRGASAIEPRSVIGRLGRYSYDAATPIMRDTWAAASASADCALSGAAAIASGARAAFALCRPPGHHASHDLYGGYCFLNNAAIAARALQRAGAARVAILDIDYHHGNGTQSIFYGDGSVLFASVHADPRDDYPYFSGHADETGEGDGRNTTINIPLPLGADYNVWSEALSGLLRCISAFGPDTLIVSLGVDIYEGDPISRFRIGSDRFASIGKDIGRLGLPTLFVMEGGYAVEAIGLNVAQALAGFETA